MKLKTKWEQSYHFYGGQQKIAYEYMDTPFGRITIVLDDTCDRYEEPYKLHIPGSDFRFFSSPSAAKQFADTYLTEEVTAYYRHIAEQLGYTINDITQPCTSNT